MATFTCQYKMQSYSFPINIMSKAEIISFYFSQTKNMILILMNKYTRNFLVIFIPYQLMALNKILHCLLALLQIYTAIRCSIRCEELYCLNIDFLHKCMSYFLVIYSYVYSHDRVDLQYFSCH